MPRDIKNWSKKKIPLKFFTIDRRNVELRFTPILSSLVSNTGSNDEKLQYPLPGLTMDQFLINEGWSSCSIEAFPPESTRSLTKGKTELSWKLWKPLHWNPSKFLQVCRFSALSSSRFLWSLVDGSDSLYILEAVIMLFFIEL